MQPKDMTLGELVCEYIQAYTEFKLVEFQSYQLDSFPSSLYNEMIDIQTKLVTRLNFLEMNIPEELEWGIPPEKAELIKNRKNYAKEIKKNTQLT